MIAAKIHNMTDNFSEHTLPGAALDPAGLALACTAVRS